MNLKPVFNSFFLLALKFPTYFLHLRCLWVRILTWQVSVVPSFLDSPCRDATYFLLASLIKIALGPLLITSIVIACPLLYICFVVLLWECGGMVRGFLVFIAWWDYQPGFLEPLDQGSIQEEWSPASPVSVGPSSHAVKSMKGPESSNRGFPRQIFGSRNVFQRNWKTR